MDPPAASAASNVEQGNVTVLDGKIRFGNVKTDAPAPASSEDQVQPPSEKETNTTQAAADDNNFLKMQGSEILSVGSDDGISMELSFVENLEDNKAGTDDEHNKQEVRSSRLSTPLKSKVYVETVTDDDDDDDDEGEMPPQHQSERIDHNMPAVAPTLQQAHHQHASGPLNRDEIDFTTSNKPFVNNSIFNDATPRSIDSVGSPVEDDQQQQMQTPDDAQEMLRKTNVPEESSAVANNVTEHRRTVPWFQLGCTAAIVVVMGGAQHMGSRWHRPKALEPEIVLVESEIFALPVQNGEPSPVFTSAIANMWSSVVEPANASNNHGVLPTLPPKEKPHKAKTWPHALKLDAVPKRSTSESSTSSHRTADFPKEAVKAVDNFASSFLLTLMVIGSVVMMLSGPSALLGQQTDTRSGSSGRFDGFLKHYTNWENTLQRSGRPFNRSESMSSILGFNAYKYEILTVSELTKILTTGFGVTPDSSDKAYLIRALVRNYEALLHSFTREQIRQLLKVKALYPHSRANKSQLIATALEQAF